MKNRGEVILVVLEFGIHVKGERERNGVTILVDKSLSSLLYNRKTRLYRDRFLFPKISFINLQYVLKLIRVST